jgi:hypothetical protein
VNLKIQDKATSLLPLQYQVMREEISNLASRYINIASDLQQSYLELVGACQAADDFIGAGGQGAPVHLAFNPSMEMLLPTLGELAEFSTFRPMRNMRGDHIQYRSSFMQRMRDLGVL